MPATSPTRGVRHILTNALGGSTDEVDVDVDLLRLEDGDRLLLCSDGLTDLVDDETIAARWSEHAALERRLPATRAARARRRRARQRHGRSSRPTPSRATEMTRQDRHAWFLPTIGTLSR